MNKNICGTQGLVFNEPLIFEKSSVGRTGYSLPECDVGHNSQKDIIPEEFIRDDLDGLPEVSEVDLVRHFTRLSQWNYSVDHGFYPLGSCTMKYNPKINEEIARMPGLSKIHPYQQEEDVQGALQIIYELGEFLAEISGMDKVSLQPAAGAQGELTGTLVIKAYHKKKGEERHKIILPDSAHGTNPASSSFCGYTTVEIKSDERGLINPASLARVMDEDVAALMLTNPNTLGLFEEDIMEITDIVHKKGGMVYCDGANLNALMGIAKMGNMGVDAMHFNLHKTFSTPHGGGGPGAGPIGVKRELAPFLPVPVIEKDNDKKFYLDYDRKDSIGKVKPFYGNFSVLVRAYAYILSLGPDQVRRVSETAIINANYLMHKLKTCFELPYNRHCMHEFVLSDKRQKEQGVQTLDIAKALIDYGFHPPTIYFPLIVKGALMIEPTETESRETLDSFIDAMIEIAQKAKEVPESFHNLPKMSRTKRLDEVKAVKDLILRWEG